uniref:Uncharacterized protein n=1 Tax=Anguilla anguilla TaxID=7936 RepID=A0A0E9W273_ANGAN
MKHQSSRCSDMVRFDRDVLYRGVKKRSK